MALSFTSCGKNKDGKQTGNEALPTTTSQGQQPSVTNQPVAGTQQNRGENTQVSTRGSAGEVLNSVKLDLDGDAKEEKIEFLQQAGQSSGNGTPGELEGKIRITGSDGERDVTFIKKAEGLTGVYSGAEFKDLDGDGVKDIFVIIPDTGNPFTQNYFYIYNYKTGDSASFSVDNSFVEFTQGFKFNYKGNGLVEMKNEKLGFTGELNIKSGSTIEIDEETVKQYVRSWVDPSSVEIREDSRLCLVEGAGGSVEIKVVLPVFGLATSDLIGEVDVFYRVGQDFKPEMKRFEVYDFEEAGKNKVGGGDLR